MSDRKIDNNPNITIIVPIYNGEKYIDRCVNSVLKQSYVKWKLILVNDGSTDSSENICKNFEKADSRISTVTQKNGGEGAARNTGLRMLDTPYVTFLDCDDELPATALTNYAEFIGKADIVVGGLTKSEKGIEKQYIPKQHTLSSHSDVVNSIIDDMYFMNVAWGKLYKSSLLLDRKILFNDFKYGEDTYFVYMCLRYADTICFINQSTYHVNAVEGSMSMRKVYNSWTYMSAIYELGSSLEPSNTYVKSQLLLRAVKTALLLETKISKDSFMRNCSQILEYVEKTDIRNVDGKYNKIILGLLLKRKFGILYGLLKVRIRLGI